MRPFALTLAAALALAGPAAAAVSAVVTDPAGDESIHLFPHLAPGAPDCAAPAADILALAIDSDDQELVVALSLADLSAMPVACGPLHVEGAAAHYDAWLQEPVPADDLLGYTFGLHMLAAVGPEGLKGCVVIAYEDGAYGDDCVGELAREGSAFVWRVPIMGSHVVNAPVDPLALVTSEEERAWDLRGRSLEPSATSRLELVDLWTGPVGSIRDQARGDPIVL